MRTVFPPAEKNKMGLPLGMEKGKNGERINAFAAVFFGAFFGAFVERLLVRGSWFLLTKLALSQAQGGEGCIFVEFPLWFLHRDYQDYPPHTTKER